MKQTVLDALTQLIEIAWRRRKIIIVPLVAALPLGLLAAYVMPQQYASKALLALQEAATDNPLATAASSGDRDARERAPGLQALIKSDRVLTNALRDVLGDAMPTDPRKVALAVRDLDSHLSFEMIGNNFLELKLTGRDRLGLGRLLQAVTARFLETLVSPGQDAMSATQVVLERYRGAADTAEKALLLYRSQIGDRALAAIAATEDQLQARAGALQTAAADIAGLDRDIAALKSMLGSAASAENVGQRGSEIRVATTQAEAAEMRHTPVALAEALIARARVAQLTQLETLEGRVGAARRDLDAAKAESVALADAAADLRSPAGQLRRLERDRDDAKAAFASYSQRFPVALSSRALHVLNAPENIRVIDAPKDPEFPTTTPIKIIVATVLACLFAGIGLAAGAEVLDQRLRRADELEAIVGVPVIATLPRVAPQADDAIRVRTHEGVARTAPSSGTGRPAFGQPTTA